MNLKFVNIKDLLFLYKIKDKITFSKLQLLKYEYDLDNFSVFSSDFLSQLNSDNRIEAYIISKMNVNSLDELIFVFGDTSDGCHYLNSLEVRQVIIGQKYLCFREKTLKEDFIYLQKLLKLKVFI